MKSKHLKKSVAGLFLVFAALWAEPRPYLRHKNLDPAAYLSRAMSSRLILGEILFRSPLILGKTLSAQHISCNSCHPHGAAADGIVIPGNTGIPGVVDLTHRSIFPAAENARDDRRRIPSLRGVRYLAPYGHDGRMHSLREFTREIIVYTFGGAELGGAELDALVAYMQQFDFLPNPKLTPAASLAATATENEKSGEKIFHAAGCARCHEPRTYFTDGKVWRLNGMATVSPYSMENAVKTPTLLRPRRARYLHDGRAEGAAVVALHANQVGLLLETKDILPLTKYLEALAVEEKPEDERHLAERASEIHSWLILPLREADMPRPRKILILKTLRENFAAFKGELKTGDDKKQFSAYLSELDRLIAIAAAADGKNFEHQLSLFHSSFGPNLRFFGTIR